MKIIEIKIPNSYARGWSVGYPESELANIKKLENGTLVENHEEIYLINTDGVKYGFKKEDYLIERSREKVLYHTPGSIKVWKSLIENGVFEIEDRVGHYCKIQTEQIYDDFSFPEHKLYSIEFDNEQLILFCNGLLQDFINPELAKNVWIKEINFNRCSLLFKSVYTIQMGLKRFSENGILHRGGRTEEWIAISDIFNNAIEIRGINIDLFETYHEFYYNQYL